MKIASLPSNEAKRLAALRAYDILDTEPEEAFDQLAQLAAYICQTPIAAISLVDENRQWFKACRGLDAKETPRDYAFCAHTILEERPLIVQDAKRDERFFDNPLVTENPNIRFYAGIPLKAAEGTLIGTLCVIDTQPRELNEAQITAIETLATSVVALLELRKSHRNIRIYMDKLQLAASVFENTSEALIVTDSENTIITVNPAFSQITGYQLEEVVGKNPKILNSGKQNQAFYQCMWQALNQHGNWRGELWNKRKNGDLYAEDLSINVVYNEDGSKRMHLASFSDITQRKAADERIWQQANFDHLTQLPNRRLFYDRLNLAIKHGQRHQTKLALMFIDLDFFKEINDTLGHDIGDKLLVEAAARISSLVREIDTVARVGGDEFTVIFENIDQIKDVEKIAENLITLLSKPYQLEQHKLQITASIGIALFPQNSTEADSLMKNADKAMYVSKQKGKNQYSIYNAAHLAQLH